MKALPAFLAVLLCIGCAPQKRFADRIKSADRMVAVYPDDGRSITITGDELQKVIRAIAAAKKESETLDCTPFLRFDFFRRDQKLESIRTCFGAFWIDKTAYVDTTKTLEAITLHWREAHPPLLQP